MQIIDFPYWWDRSEFFKKFGSRQIDKGSPIYTDFALLLTQPEAWHWDENCRKSFRDNTGLNSAELTRRMENLQLLLKEAGWIIVESCEWESGLD